MDLRCSALPHTDGAHAHTWWAGCMQCLQRTCTRATWCVCEEFVGHVSQRQDGDHAVVTIGFNEVVASDGGWIDVVLPEWTDKRLQREKGRGEGGGRDWNNKHYQNNHFLQPASLIQMLMKHILWYKQGAVKRWTCTEYKRLFAGLKCKITFRTERAKAGFVFFYIFLFYKITESREKIGDRWVWRLYSKELWNLEEQMYTIGLNERNFHIFLSCLTVFAKRRCVFTSFFLTLAF